MKAPKKIKIQPATDMPKKRLAHAQRQAAQPARHTWPNPARLAHEAVANHGKVGGRPVSWLVLDEPLQLSTPLPPGGGIISGNLAADIATGTLVRKLHSAGVDVHVPTPEEEAAELAQLGNMSQEELNAHFGMDPADVAQWQQEL